MLYRGHIMNSYSDVAKEKLNCSLDFGLNDFLTCTMFRNDDYDQSVISLYRYFEIIYTRYLRRLEGLEL